MFVFNSLLLFQWTGKEANRIAKQTICMSRCSRYLFLVGNGIDGPIKTFHFCFVFSSLREGDEDFLFKEIFSISFIVWFSRIWILKWI